jgi:hypothetical protein
MKHPNKELTVMIRGKPWNIFVEDLKGLAIHQRGIYVNPNHYGKDFLDSLLHEVCHANFPYLGEKAVAETATSMATVLWSLGYRNMNERTKPKRRKK